MKILRIENAIRTIYFTLKLPCFELIFCYSVQNTDMDQLLLLVYLGMIGKFGLTTSEKVYTTTYAYYSTMNSDNVSNYKTPIRPTKWVHFVVEHLDVIFLFAHEWRSLVGAHYFYSVNGLTEVLRVYS
jgi:hypothetical protein